MHQLTSVTPLDISPMNIMQRPGQNAELKFLHQRRFHLLPATFAAAAADSSEVTETGRRYVLNLFRTPWLRALMSERAQATCMPMSSDARPVLRKRYIYNYGCGWALLGRIFICFFCRHVREGDWNNASESIFFPPYFQSYLAILGE